MSKYKHFADEIRAAKPEISNAQLGAEVKARIKAEDPAPTPYDIHGRPDPMDTDIVITDAVRDKVAIVTGGDKKGLMIQYIRDSAPVVSKIIVDVNAGAVFNKLMRGTPIGVMVAFMDEGRLLIGWSKYNQAVVKDKDGKVVLTNGKPAQIEQLIFTKKDAIETAVLRGLTTSIRTSAAGSDESNVPFKIEEQLSAFLERVEKYFKAKPSNIDTGIETVGYA